MLLKSIRDHEVGEQQQGGAPTMASPVLSVAISTIVPEAECITTAEWRELFHCIDGVLDRRPPALRRQFQVFLRAIEWLPVLRYGTRFTRLDGQKRVRCLGYLESHPLQIVRVAFWGLRNLALLGYYSRSEAATAIGYAPSMFGEASVE